MPPRFLFTLFYLVFLHCIYHYLKYYTTVGSPSIPRLQTVRQESSLFDCLLYENKAWHRGGRKKKREKPKRKERRGERKGRKKTKRKQGIKDKGCVLKKNLSTYFILNLNLHKRWLVALYPSILVRWTSDEPREDLCSSPSCPVATEISPVP